MDNLDLIFRTADRRGLCAANHVLYNNAPFFDGTLELEYTNTNDVYIETTSYELDKAKREELRDFSRTAKSFAYTTFAYGGKPDWSTDYGTWQIGSFISSVIHFNERYPDAAFKGVLLDVQPYEVMGCRSTESFRKCLEWYTDAVRQAHTKVRAHNLLRYNDFQLKIVMPIQLYLLAGEGHITNLRGACDEVIRVDYVD